MTSGGMLLLGVLVAAGMELWARVVHRFVWHGVLYGVHRSHHEPSGWLEANDLFALVHAVPAAAMIVWGLSGAGFGRDLALAIGGGMTAFGAAYFIVHDGYVHGRLPVAFLDRIRWFRRLKAAHQAHHVGGEVPYGLFLGPRELRQRSIDVARRRQGDRVARR